MWRWRDVCVKSTLTTDACASGRRIRNPHLTFQSRAGNAAHVRSVVRILVAEDDADIATLVKHALERDGDLHVDIAANGELALQAVRKAVPALMILDLSLPIIDGLEVCRRVRSRLTSAALPIIMLTARSGDADHVSGLDLGADDYVTKPFSLRELAARVRAVLRRTQDQTIRTAVYRGAHLMADFDAVAVAVDGQPVRLTRREFDLLRYLIEHRNQVVSRGRLLKHVWGYNPSTETRSVDVHIRRLRFKLTTAGRQIETVVKSGYRFVE